MANLDPDRGTLPRTTVSLSPQGRGSGDTLGGGLGAIPVRQFWVGRRLWQMLVLSLLLHVLLSPAPLLLGLGVLLPALTRQSEPLEPEEAVNAIPIDLLESDPGVTSGPEGAEPPAPLPVPPEAPHGDAAVVRPQPSEAPARVEKPAAEPQVPLAAPKGAEGKEFADPVALAGSAGELADSNAHVRILIYSQVIRSHPLGPRVGGLLRRTPQWRDFFGPSGVDPVVDVERVLIAGPQLRDSSNVVAVVEHRLPQEQIVAALDRLVLRRGTWLRQKPPLARARADRADRIFAAPREGIVAVGPPSAEESLRRLGPGLRFGPGPEGVALQAFVDRPHRPLAALGLRIPESLVWLRAEILPDPLGGVKIKLLAQDESPKSARQHAEELQALLRSAAEVDFSRMGTLGALASLAFGGPKQKMVDQIDLYAEKDQVRGLISMTKEQLLNLTDLLDAFLPPEPKLAPEAGESGATTEGMPRDEAGGALAPGSGGSASGEEEPRSAPAPADGSSGGGASSPQSQDQPDESLPIQDAPPVGPNPESGEAARP